jgi:hypothetical protein
LIEPKKKERESEAAVGMVAKEFKTEAQDIKFISAKKW